MDPSEINVRQAAADTLKLLNDHWPRTLPVEWENLDAFPERYRDQIAHAKFMLSEIPKFLDSGLVHKAERWLCFAQGIMWSTKDTPISEMAVINRSARIISGEI
ncbi:MAG: hypothetical protein Q8R25_04015 [bacterium]|nr:hypothetical protein [bacterium]